MLVAKLYPTLCDHKDYCPPIAEENFLNMGKEIVSQVLEAQSVPGRINPRRNTQRLIVIKLTKIKDKDKTLKSTREE